MRVLVCLPSIPMLAVASACADKPSMDTAPGGGDSGGSGETAELDCASQEGVRFVSADGTIQDRTQEFAAGSAGAPASIAIDQDGVLEVCGGTWNVLLDVRSADLVLRGDARVSQPVLSGGGSGPIIQVRTPGARFVAEDLDFTGAIACFGSVLTAADMAVPCDQEALPVQADITFRRSRLVGNAFDFGGGVVGVTGGIVTLEDTLISDNDGHGVFALGGDVRCTGSAEVEAGLKNNSKSGVWISEPGQDAGRTLVSEGCDWGGNGQDDVRLDTETYFTGFGDDADFTCDAIALTCG